MVTWSLAFIHSFMPGWNSLNKLKVQFDSSAFVLIGKHGVIWWNRTNCNPNDGWLCRSITFTPGCWCSSEEKTVLSNPQCCGQYKARTSDILFLDKATFCLNGFLNIHKCRKCPHNISLGRWIGRRETNEWHTRCPI